MRYWRTLQLCRPLSGAVSTTAGLALLASRRRFNCAAPFRGRLVDIAMPSLFPRCRFNCAAPFRGRLERKAPHSRHWAAALQLCRPLSGAVRSTALRTAVQAYRFNCAAPFRGRLAAEQGFERLFVGASIVPPPFGGG